MIIEIAVFNLESAIVAYNAGAHRIELCSGIAGGGLTPSAATMRLAKKYVKIPIHVMIRPREGDFCYSEKEFETMLLDIAAAKIVGMEGIVAGILNPDGSVDTERMAVVVNSAAPMNVTFHRAFDMSNNLEKAMESVISIGCTRILTSAGRQTAIEGLEKLTSLVDKAGDRIIIIPGSGINLDNFKEIANKTLAKEIHLSARCFIQGKMSFKQKFVTMASNTVLSDYELQLPDEKMIKDLLKLFV